MDKQTKKGSKKPLVIGGVILAVVVIIVALLLTRCGTENGPGGSAVDGSQLAQLLAQEGTQTIRVDENVVITGRVEVNGNKTIEGEGKIILSEPLEGTWADTDAPTWSMGCEMTPAEDATQMPAALNVTAGSSLKLGGVTIDVQGNANGVLVEKGAKLEVAQDTLIQGGKYANLVVVEGAEVTLSGGQLLDSAVNNVINYGTLNITGGTISGAKAGAAVYNVGTMTQSGGTISGAGLHNVFVAEGSFTMTGGTNDGATKDGIVVAKGASAEVTGGTITNCVHGLCNSGTLNADAVLLSECGIMNYETGVMELVGTTVDTASVYCLANNGGQVTATDFTAAKCDTCAVYNFSGDIVLNNLTVTGSRDGNLSNAGGNMTVNGATLGVCRDKSVTVGSGVAILNDVSIEGTTGEKYGVYAFGGKLYINDSTIVNVSSSAVKLDMGSYVELSNVTIQDAEQNGFQTDGGQLVANNVTMENLGSHGIYNNGGTITATDLKVTGVKKNAIQQKSGTTTLTNVEAAVMGNHGAYVADGALTVTGGSFTDMEANGFYLVEGEGQLTLEDVTITDAVQQGINNSATVSVKNVTISNTGMNGIYNKVGGTVTVDGLVVTDVAEHGINNKADMTATNVTVKNTGDGSNGIQNNGTMTLTGANVENSKNHGIYNSGDLTASNVTINGTTANGVYNDKGDADITGLTVSNSGTQGVNNNSTITLKDVKITGAGSNGIYNSAGTATVENLTVNGTNEHGVNNASQMIVTGANIKNTGNSKNGVQNSGTLNLTNCVISTSKNHGVYNSGDLTASSLTVKGTAANGVYNDKGEASITGLTISNTGTQGVNNNSVITLKDVQISGVGSNGIYNSAGTATVENLTVNGANEHGINNVAQMTVTGADIKNTGAEKNGVQNSGTLSLNSCVITASKNHGIYNSGTLSGGDVTINGTEDNGIYNAKGTVNALAGLTITGTANQGINNTGTFVASSVRVSGTGKNGVYNNGGSATITGLTVTNPGEHGISNDNGGTVTLVNATFTGSGKGSNCIQNKSVMTVTNVTIKDSKNHGIYNDSQFNAKGSLIISGSMVNGLYNYGGTVNLEKAEISATGSHGINNAGTLEAGALTIKGVTDNGIQNTGSMTITGSAVITDSGKHGMYNGKTFVGSNITIKNAGDLLASNAGSMNITGLTLTGSAHKAFYNSGYAELYTVTVDGTDISYASAQYLIDNNGGVLDLTDATVLNAKGTALHNRGKASASVTNVIIDHVGNYGMFVESGSTVSGDGLVINNVTKNTEAVSNAEGIAIKTAGKVTMMDHVTLGDYDDAVTGSGITIDKSTSGLANAGLQLDATTAGFSGYDLVIKNSPSANAVYNKGQMYVTDLYVENVKHGVVTRYDGWVTLSGAVTIKDVLNNPVSVYGPESNGYKNGVTLTSGASMTIENAGSHAINNKGSFLAAADTNITIKNVVGKNVNAINNQGGATMTLGNVTIDGVYVTISMYNDTTINSNSGNGIQSNSAMEINGDVVISNIFYKAENNKTDNSNGTGVVVKNGGKITGTGSITVIGSQTAPAQYEGYAGLFNGIFVTKCTLDIDGDITVSNAKNQGIYAADANAYVGANNITVTGSQGNGIYVNNATGALDAKGSITISNSLGGGHGLSTVGAVSAAEVTINDTIGSDKNGIEVKAGGKLTVTGTISITNSGKRGLNNAGTVSAANLTIDGFGENGIQNAGTLKVSGAISVANGKGTGHGVYNSATLEAGSLTVSDVTRNGINNAGILTVSGKVLIKNAVQGGIGTNKTFSAGDVEIDTVTAGPGINNSGTFTVTGTTTIKNVTGTDVNAIQNKNTMTLNDVVIDGLYVTVGNDADGKQMTNVGNGIFNNKTLTLNGTATITNVFTNVKNNSIGAGVTLASGSKLTGSGSLIITGTASSNEAYPYGINNGIFIDAAALELSGDITVTNVTNQGIYVANENASLSAGNITVKNAGGNGIYINKTTGSMTVSGDVTIDGTNNHGMSNVGTVNAGNVTIRNIPNKNGLENTGSVTVTGTLSVSGVATGYGIHSKSGTVQAATMEVSNVQANIGIFLEGGATLRGYDVTVSDISNGQGIQANHANTIEIQTLTMTNISKNGLRLYNNSGNPTVTIGTVVASDCAEWAIAAAKELTSSNLNIGVVYWANCGSGAVHGNIKSGVGQIINELPAEDNSSAAETTN